MEPEDGIYNKYTKNIINYIIFIVLWENLGFRDYELRNKKIFSILSSVFALMISFSLILVFQ